MLARVPQLYAQVDSGAILGTVKDQSGAVVPGAKVTLTNEGTSFSKSTLSGPEGSYLFIPIKIGTYTVTAELQGFQKVVRPHVTVDIQQTVEVDFALVPGAITQVVEVTAAAPLLQIASGSVGSVVQARQINQLPLNGRNYTFLAQLNPGVTFAQPDTRGLNASGSFTANGVRPAQNNYLLDGIDNNNDSVDFFSGAAYVVRPPIDAIAEFKIQTNSYDAEFGRGAGAVLNATVKSGTNQLHGNVWEFIRNDKLDAADFFQNAQRVQKGEYRQNQFGFTLGGPVYVPHVYNGKNKTFWFFDYEGTRIRQVSPLAATVPTVAERNSGYTDFSDLIAGQSSTRTDALGRVTPLGTIYDPATTRPVTAGQMDPVTGLTATQNGFVRDPFPGNRIPANRLDANQTKLLNLYPLPTTSALFSNFLAVPANKDNTNAFDVRVDQNFSSRDQLFARVSYSDEPILKPGPFQGVADGADYTRGIAVNTARNIAVSYTHTFSPTMINEARLGYSGERNQRTQAFSDTMGIPAQYGIQGIPQTAANGGLPEIDIGDLSRLGTIYYYPAIRLDSIQPQVTENLTKIHGAHAFKGGFEHQSIKSYYVASVYPRGDFGFSGAHTSIPGISDASTGTADFLLDPINSTVPNGIDGIGGFESVGASPPGGYDLRRKYYGAYFQDDWKVTPRLTLNLGIRWEFFTSQAEKYGANANFIPGPGFVGGTFMIQRGEDQLSPAFGPLLAKDGITLQRPVNEPWGLYNQPKDNFAPRFGFAYRATNKLVVRGGYGIFYGEEANSGNTPSFNYPYSYGLYYYAPNDHAPFIINGLPATLGNGLLGVPLTPASLDPHGLSLLNYQFNPKTPAAQNFNLVLQRELTPNQSIEIGYVASLSRHLMTRGGANPVTKMLPPGTTLQLYVPYPDFARGGQVNFFAGNSYYHSLQFKFERRFSHGLNFLGAYTYSKVRTNAPDLLNGGGERGFRAFGLPGWNMNQDYHLAPYDIRQALHFSGTYELPVGGGKRFLGNGSGALNQFVGGWSMNWIMTMQDGNPQGIPCSVTTNAAYGCYALLVPGQNRIGGTHNVNQFYNPLAFANPAPATTIGQTDLTPLGGAQTQVVGPGFHRFDLSVFKQFRTSEKTYFEFRAEFFNFTNTPNFALPSILNFSDKKNFGKITATRDNPNDPRQIQFALKFYF